VRDLTELTVGSHDFRFDPPLREHVICQVAVRRQIAGWWKDAKFVRCIHALSVEGVNTPNEPTTLTWTYRSLSENCRDDNTASR
jgi:hypothetical protein